jgi:hypothetical protein
MCNNKYKGDFLFEIMIIIRKVSGKINFRLQIYS